MTKWFWLHQNIGDIPFQFHKELVDDIRKLMFSLRPSLLEDNAHRGIIIFVFVLTSVTEENQIREDQEARNGATAITPFGVKAFKRKCPPIPSTFDQLERILVRYLKVGELLFTTLCKNFIEVGRLYQELMLMYWMNGGSLPAATITTIVWDVVTDASHFLHFPN